MLVIGPGDSQALLSPGHQHRSTEVRSQDCSSHVSGPIEGAMEAAQTLSWPSPHMCMPTNPAAAEARPISASGAFVVHLDVLQALNSRSCQQRCKSVVRAATRRDFSSSSLVTRPLRLSGGFSPTSVWEPPTSCAPESAGAHEPSQAGGGRGGNQGMWASQAGWCQGGD